MTRRSVARMQSRRPGIRDAHPAFRCAACGLLGLLLLAGCSVDPPPPDRYYRIAAPSPEAERQITQRVLVETVQAHGVYSERPLLFRSDRGALQQYYYHLWAEPPDMLLSDALAGYLREHLGAQQVFVPAARVRPDVVVRTRLRKLELVVTEDGARAAFAARFIVSAGADKLLFTVDFDEEEPMARAEPTEFVAAVEKLAGRAFALVAQGLIEHQPPQ